MTVRQAVRAHFRGVKNGGLVMYRGAKVQAWFRPSFISFGGVFPSIAYPYAYDAVRVRELDRVKLRSKRG